MPELWFIFIHLYTLNKIWNMMDVLPVENLILGQFILIALCFLLTNSYLQLYISDTIYNNTSFLILFNLTCKTCSITLIWSKLCLMTKTGTEFRSDLLKFTLFSCHCYRHSTVTFPLFSNLVRRFLIINNLAFG